MYIYTYAKFSKNSSFQITVIIGYNGAGFLSAQGRECDEVARIPIYYAVIPAGIACDAARDRLAGGSQ